jgi:hypothetical protein
MLINKIAEEACGTDIWKWCNKIKRRIGNDATLSLVADMFASVAPFPSEGTCVGV